MVEEKIENNITTKAKGEEIFIKQKCQTEDSKKLM
jgi:hypothetical protein